MTHAEQNVGETEVYVLQIKTVWTSLDKRKQVIVLFASLAVFISVLAMSRMAASPSMSLLYAGLENGAAGDVVRVLEQNGVQYDVRGGSIYVPSNQRDQLRMTLASEGLPTNGGKGYELLDSLSGFRTTSQMFDAAYWRAKEGELARTIVASPFASQARVHIANGSSSPFQKNTTATASVSITPAGSPITAAQANALRNLIASAVAGLNSENVAVIDSNGVLIGSTDAPATSSTSDDRAQHLRDKVLRLVEARVGSGNAVVEISVDTVTETESIRERRFDPEGRVAISTDTEETVNSSTNQSGGEVTVASNLPDGDGAGGDGSKANASETRERVNYEVSETEHEILRVPGAVKRLTVAVLVNGLRTTNDAGEVTFQQRPEEELSALHDLVASAVGFDVERGDVITLKSMDLPPVVPPGTAAKTSLFGQLQLDAISLIQIGVLAVVSLILGLFVVRPIIVNQAKMPTPALAPPAENTLVSAPGEPVLTGEIDDQTDGQFSGQNNLGSSQFGSGIAVIGENSGNSVERLRAMIGDRQDETVEILRSWLEEREENA